MSNFLALAIDPGETTGFCLAYKDNEKLFLAPFEEAWEVNDLWNALETYNPDYIICEDFEYRPGKAKPSLVLFSVQLIGVVRLYARTPGLGTHLYMQKASYAVGPKAFFKDSKLKNLGIYPKGIRHGRDALRHFMMWFQFGRGYEFNDQPTLELVERSFIYETYMRSYLR